jgi:GLPGLI family protein
MKSLRTIAFMGLAIMQFIFTQETIAQDFQGKAIYQTKTTMDMGNWGGREMSEQQRKQIMERMKNFLEKTYILTFNKTESIYKEDEKLEAPGAGGGGWGGFASSFTGGPQYKNVKNQEIRQEQEFFGKKFLVKDELKKLDWQMTNESKQIGQYLCFKAVAVKEVDEFDWRSMRRRNDEKETKKEADTTNTTTIIEDIEIPKTIEIVAWYTPQIPVNQGPGEYWGLPGLILEVNADRTTILCTKIILNPAEKETIVVPSKGKEITQEEYNATVKQKMEEMREMYGGRNRGGGRF